VLTGSLRGFAELDILGETNSVSCRQDAIETDFLRISDRLEVIRRESWFTAGEKNDDLSLGLE